MIERNGSFFLACASAFMPIFNIWTHLFACFAASAVIFPYTATKGIYTLLFTRSSTYNLYSNKTSPYWKWKGERGGHLLYPGLRTRLGWSRRMVHPPTPIPSSLFLPAFCESLHLSPYSSFSFALSFSIADPLHEIQIIMHDVKHGYDYLAISRYESLNPVNAHHCSHAYSRSFPLRWNIMDNLWCRSKIEIY